jgi:RNA polymerase sigma factor (sigma-70 family)
MEVGILIYRVRAGDVCAFTELVRRYQGMAFAYAFSLLQDFQLAEDAAQEAFLTVYAELRSLQEPEAFPGWLRGIVRHCCQRIRRKRRIPVAPLEHGIGIAAQQDEPERQIEAREMRAYVLAAIQALPQAQREVTTLFYIQEHSQQEIAAFLGVPVTTVNNRLHAARTKLRRRMLPMVKETLQENTLPADFAERVGRIVQVQGPVIDAQFAPESLPAIFSALTITPPAGGPEVTVEVAQHLDNGVARCIAVTPVQGLADGLKVVDTGEPVRRPVPGETLSQVFPVFGQARTETPEVLETGIKAIDLFSPYARGGRVALSAEWCVGVLVLIPEIVRNIAVNQGGVSLFTFVKTPADAASWKEINREITIAKGEIQTIYVPTSDPNAPDFLASVAFLDATTHLSRRMAIQGLYPAIDPLASHSRLLDTATVGPEHLEVAEGVRALLQRYAALKESLDTTEAEAASKEEQTMVARARRALRFLTQPFFVAEPYTKQPGQYVRREETLQGFRAILEGACDALPEEAFLFCGNLDQVREKAQQLGR